MKWDKIERHTERYLDRYLKRQYIPLFVFVSLVLLIAGIFSPTLTMRKFIIFKNTVSIYSGLIALFEKKSYILFLLIFTFSIVFPIAKNLLLLYITSLADWTKASVRKAIDWLEWLGRWSMLDVFVVALLVVIVELRLLADVEVHIGIYLFAVSVLLTNCTAAFVHHMIKKQKIVDETQGTEPKEYDDQQPA